MSGLVNVYLYITTCQFCIKSNSYSILPPNINNYFPNTDYMKVRRERERINKLKQHTIQYDAYKKQIAIINRIKPGEPLNYYKENARFKKEYLKMNETNEPPIKKDIVAETLFQENKKLLFVTLACHLSALQVAIRAIVLYILTSIAIAATAVATTAPADAALTAASIAACCLAAASFTAAVAVAAAAVAAVASAGVAAGVAAATHELLSILR